MGTDVKGMSPSVKRVEDHYGQISHSRMLIAFSSACLTAVWYPVPTARSSLCDGG